MRSWLNRLLATIRTRRLQDDLDAELQFHIEQRTADLIAQGVAPAEARREATSRFGNRTLLQERTRDRDVLVWLETTLQDIRYALRTFRRNPVFAATAIVSLALGIGANTALFSLLDALLLRSMPVREPNRLVRLRVNIPPDQTTSFSYPLFDLIRKHAHLYSGAIAVGPRGDSILEQGESVPALVEAVSAEYFEVLGVSASQGRMFRDASESVAVISDSFAQAHYHSSAIGARFRARDRDYTVVGVADVRFRGTLLDRPADVWIPIEQIVPANSPQRSANWSWLDVIARLAPGASEKQALDEVNALQAQFQQELVPQSRFDHPQQLAKFLAQRIESEPAAAGISNLRERYGKPLMVIQCIAVIVLLIACASLANLLLSRGTSRERELSIRQAIGAGRVRLIRQLLTETLVLSLAGACVAFLLARWLSVTLLRFLPESSPALTNLSFRVDARLLLFMTAATLGVCLLAGLAPAIRATRSGSARRALGGRILIVAEVAMCTLLVVGAGWFLRTLLNLRTLDAGFSRDHVLVGIVGPPREYSGAQALERFERLRTRLAALPQVRNAGYSNFSLMVGDGITSDVEAEGRVPQANQDRGSVELRVSPVFFSSMGTAILAGRDFDDRDDSNAPKVAIVNDAFARKFFGGDAIGKYFGLGGPKSSHDIEIVGVVRDTKYFNLREKPTAIFYRPFRQIHQDTGMVIAIRASGDLSGVAALLRDTAREVDPRLTLRGVSPFSNLIDTSLTPERMLAQVSTGFGLLALLVAGIGLYGVQAYRVARRTREIGIRIALGASRAGVQWMILRESVALLIAGFAIGIPLALAMTRFVRSMLFGLTPSDPITIGAAIFVLAVVSLAAAALPARRASKVDPMISLRCD